MSIVNGVLSQVLHGTIGGVLLGAAAPVPFPSSIPNLFSRYRGDQVTLTGGKVSTWQDISGNSRNVSQATSGNRPTYTLTINGNNVVSFSGSQYLSNASVYSLTNATVLAVIRTSSAASTYNYNGDAPLTIVGDSTGNVVFGFGAGSGSVASSSFTGGGPFGGWVHINGSKTVNDNKAHTVGMTFVSSGAMTNKVDNATDGSGTGSGGVVEYDSIGRGFDVRDAFIGDMGEVVIYNRVLNATELGQLEAYFQSYWGTP